MEAVMDDGIVSKLRKAVSLRDFLPALILTSSVFPGLNHLHEQFLRKS